MADRLWGANPSDEDLPFAIVHGHFAPGMAVGNAATGYTGTGWFQMPWPGNLAVSLTASASWALGGHQQWSIHLANSSPGPNSYSYFNQIAHNDYTGVTRGQLPAYAMWNNLTKGQTVNFTLFIGVGGGGHTVTLEWIGETIRAWPG